MRKLFLFMGLLLLVPAVFAKDITFSLNQSEYYFLVGQQAVLPLEIDNRYNKQIDGMLSYTITQEVNQQGFHYSSTNTNSQPFSVKEGKDTMDIGFGTSDSPLTLRVSLSFGFNEKGDKIVDLDEILINFVQDESQKQDKQDKQESKSEKVNQQSLAEQMQEQLDKMFNKEQQQEPSTQSKLQNNQLAQDSNALKQQIQREMQEQNRIDEAFRENLANNPDFQREHNKLIEEGYEPKTGNINALNESSGEFEVNYGKNGESASLKGRMENNEIKEIERETSEDINRIMDKIENDERFHAFDEELTNESFVRQGPDIREEGNATYVDVLYLNEKNETAVIKAKVEGENVKEVKLERPMGNYWWVVILVLAFVLGYFIYNKYFRKEEFIEEKKVQKMIDYKKEAGNILAEAEGLFDSGREKDAYGKAASAMRFYYSYKLGLNAEITNSDIIKVLKRAKIKYDQAQKCLNLCSLVGFAKYRTNKDDFGMIVKLVRLIIR
ncbi:MAG: hypothetical protein KAK00_09495 [Nanoarchaeota archaeon]|nr:hypothetical protein [Nanoarchaeota archaeon]